MPTANPQHLCWCLAYINYDGSLTPCEVEAGVCHEAALHSDLDRLFATASLLNNNSRLNGWPGWYTVIPLPPGLRMADED